MHNLLGALLSLVVSVAHHRVESLLLTRVFLPREVVPWLVLSIDTEVSVVDILKTGLVGWALVYAVWPFVCVEFVSLFESYSTVWLWAAHISTGRLHVFALFLL